MNETAAQLAATNKTQGRHEVRAFPYNRRMIPRFYCPALDASADTVTLPDAAAHHAARVLRLRSGDAVTLFDGNGAERRGTIAEVGREVTVCVQSVGAGIAEPPLHFTLVQALPSCDKMDWVVQRAVELGAVAVQPVMARRSLVRLEGDRARKRVLHWQEVA